MPPHRILIVGHGYVGSRLAEMLARRGKAVVAANRSEETSRSYPVLQADLGSIDSLNRLKSTFPAPDAIVHCASSGRGGADAYRTVFVEGMENLGTVYPGVPVILTSSSSVYGQTDGSVVTEKSETSPNRETSRSLCEAEDLARETGGIALRLAGIYGPSRSVHLQKMLEGSATIESGEVSRYLNQVHRDDAAGAILHLLDHFEFRPGGAVFNVADDDPITQRECYERLAEFFDLPLPPEAPPDLNRKRAWTNKIVSNEALRATGWKPAFPSFIGALTEDERLIPSIRARIG